MTTARELTNELASMLQRERGGLVDFLLAFSDFHANKRWRELEYASAFAYLRGELKLSEGAAYNRIVAAELIHGVPEVAAALLSGALCFSTVTQVAKVVTPENKDDLLPRFFRLSRSQAEELAVSLRPIAVIPVREVVTAIRPPLALREPPWPSRPQPERPALHPPSAPRPSDFLGVKLRPGWTVVLAALNFTR